MTHRRPRFVEKSLRYATGRYLYVDISKAQQVLGYEVSPLEEAVAEAVDWFRNGFRAHARSSIG